MASYSSTRWWSKWEVQLQLLEYFGDVEGFLRTNSDLGLATRAKLLQFFDDLQKKVLLQIELAAVIDSGERFVKACYNLEGDGILSLSTYELINTVVMGIQTAHWPNLSAVVKSLSQENAVQQQLMDYGRKCIGKGYTYFDQQISKLKWKSLKWLVYSHLLRCNLSSQIPLHFNSSWQFCLS